MSQIKYEDYQSKFISNTKVEWLIEHGKVHEVVYFKGACGDRYTIYVASKRNKSTIDFHTVYNGYDYGTTKGSHIATIKNYILTTTGIDNRWQGFGYTIKQLMRQGIVSKQFPWKLRYCRSAYFMKLSADPGTKGFSEFTPWVGMKISFKTGLLINKPNRYSIKEYKRAKETDSNQRKANYLSNKHNREALERYRNAGGDTEAARKWDSQPGEGIENINWDLVPMDDVFKHRNATLRSNIIEHYGMNAILKTLTYDVVDEDTIDGRYYKLLDVEIPDLSDNVRAFNDRTHKGLYLEMINPSTGESHFEGISNVNSWDGPRESTVKAALSWRDGDKAILNEFNTGDINYIIPDILT